MLSFSAVLLIVIAILALTKFSSSQPVADANSTGSDESFLDNFSLKTYRPMLRLVSQMDRRFLESAHGSKFRSRPPPHSTAVAAWLSP